jgi:hypothetical protein
MCCRRQAARRRNNKHVCPQAVLLLQGVSNGEGTWAARALVGLQPARGDALVRAFGRSAHIVFDAARVESWLDEGGSDDPMVGKKKKDRQGR